MYFWLVCKRLMSHNNGQKTGEFGIVFHLCEQGKENRTVMVVIERVNQPAERR